MIVRIHAGQDAGAARAARGCGDIASREFDALVEDPDLRVRHKIHAVMALIVADDNDDIGMRRRH